MRKIVYRLKRFRLAEISLVDRPACDIATVERIELAKRGGFSDQLPLTDSLHSNQAEEKFTMTTQELDALPDSAFAYIEPGGRKDAEGKTVPRKLRHFPIHDAAHVRNALARVKDSAFGEQALPAILDAAARFGIETGSGASGTKERGASDGSRSSSVDSGAMGKREESSVKAQVAEHQALGGAMHPIGLQAPLAVRGCDLEKFIPIQSLAILKQDDRPTAATSFAKAIAEDAIDRQLPELCDMFMQVVSNIIAADDIEDKAGAILAALEEFKSAVEDLVGDPDLVKRLGLGDHRERSIKVERAVRLALHKRALAEAIREVEFEWPAGAAAVRLLGKGDQVIGEISRAEFDQGGKVLSSTERRNIHEARNMLMGLCARGGCVHDSALKRRLEAAIVDAEVGAQEDPAATVSRLPSVRTELGKLLENLREAAGTLGAAAGEVRKVAEASAGSIRKADGSAKVLSALAERVARLEAQPDGSRPQPLRTVEKGTPLGCYGPELENSRLRIAELQREAAELRKQANDGAAQKRLQEIGVEIIRLSNGVDPAAAVFRAATAR